MTEFTADHFQSLCSAGPVRAQIDTTETNRKSAVKKFWTFLILGLAISIAAGFVLGGIDMTVGMFAFVGLVVGTLFLAFRPLSKASNALKLPVLEALAEQGNLTYVPEGFEPPIFASASKALFGSWLSTTSFTDLITGTDPEGRNFAVYEATLHRGSGKHKQEVFSGQIYAFERRAGGEATTVIVPDRGMFNFVKPERGMERVKFEQDAEFESRFEVYSTSPADAQALLSSSEFRRRLVEHRGKGKLFLYAGPSEALIAVTGPDRFEPGSMFKSMAGEERVRRMFDEVCESLRILNELKAALG